MQYKVCALLCVLWGLAFSLAAAEVPDVPDTDDDQLELLILFDPVVMPGSAAELARDLTFRGEASVLASKLGRTSAVLFPFARTGSAEFQTRNARPSNHPYSLLERTMVVRYPSLSDLSDALVQLKSDHSVLNVGKIGTLRVSHSADPYQTFNPQYPGVGQYQWGHQALRVVEAWARQRGHAFLASGDRGLYGVNGQFHPDLKKNFKSHFSRAPINTGPNNALDYYFVDPVNYFGSDFHITHGTHTSGIMIATADNGLGVAGVCRDCSLAMLRTDTKGSGVARAISEPLVAAALLESIRSGAQVFNASFGAQGGTCTGLAQPICQITQVAVARQLSLIASSGNFAAEIAFPATHDDWMAVGGLQLNAANSTPSFWVNSSFDCTTHHYTTSDMDGQGSNCGDQQWVVAPAKDVLSTTPPGATAYNGFCGDRMDPSPNSVYLSAGYGDCTGTSMSAPYVSGIAGLVRSSNPLLTGADTKALIGRWSSGNGTKVIISGDGGKRLGYGIPRADDAVIAAMSGATAQSPSTYNATYVNRLSPLFALYSSTAINHFYTTVPQMATAAWYGTLLPSPKIILDPSTTNNASCPTSGGSCLINTLVPLDPPVTIRDPMGNALPNVQVMVSGLANPNVDKSSDRGYGVAATDSAGRIYTVPNLYFLSQPPQPAAPLDVYLMSTDYAVTYSPIGQLVPGYASFPCDSGTCPTARAIGSVFSSHLNPLSPIDPVTGLPGAPELAPLHRLSWRCGDGTSVACGTNKLHVSHFYTTNSDEVGAYTGKDVNGNPLGGSSKGYKLDGIEGYIFPTSQWQAGTQPTEFKLLCRKYDPAREDFILFLGSNLADCMTTINDGLQTGGNYSQPEPVTQSYFIGYVKDVVPPSSVSASPPQSIIMCQPNSACVRPSGDYQTAAVDTAFANPLAVQVRDSTGQPMVGVTVSFSAPTTDPSAILSPPSGRSINVATDANGVASISASAACTIVGSYVVTATTAGIASSVTFHLTNSIGSPHFVAASSGVQQSAEVVHSFANLVARVTDCGSNAVPNQSVTFTPAIASTGATATLGVPTVTNDQGYASVDATANTKAGTYAVTPSRSGALTVGTFQLTNTAGPAYKLVGPSPNPTLSAPAGTSFGTLTVWIRDQFDNSITNSSVAFNAPSSGPSVTFAPTINVNTDATGAAQVVAIANSIVSNPVGTTYAVTASKVGMQGSPFTFNLTNVQPPPPPTVRNNGFESPVVSGANSGTNNLINDWTCSGLCGLQHNAWQTSPEGVQTAYVSGMPDPLFPVGAISQSQVNFAAAGTFKLRFNAARRPGNTTDQPIRVKVANSQVGSLISPINGTFGQYETTSTFTINTAGMYQIGFEATKTTDVTAPTSLIDAVSIVFASATPTRNIAIDAGNYQSAAGNSQFNTQLKVRITEGGNGVSGATVTFNVPGVSANPVYPPATATLSSYTATTDANGYAGVTATANNMAGTYNVNASTNGAAAPVGFTLTNTKLSPYIVNANFEYPATPGNTMWEPSGAGWSFDGRFTGVTDTYIYSNPTPSGTQAAILTPFAQDGGPPASISQTIYFPVGGTYSLSFLTATPDGAGDQGITAFIDGGALGTSCMPDATWITCAQVNPFTISAGNHTLKLQITNNQWYYYPQIMVDQISIQ